MFSKDFENILVVTEPPNDKEKVGKTVMGAVSHDPLPPPPLVSLKQFKSLGSLENC